MQLYQIKSRIHDHLRLLGPCIKLPTPFYFTIQLNALYVHVNQTNTIILYHTQLCSKSNDSEQWRATNISRKISFGKRAHYLILELYLESPLYIYLELCLYKPGKYKLGASGLDRKLDWRPGMLVYEPSARGERLHNRSGTCFP